MLQAKASGVHDLLPLQRDAAALLSYIEGDEVRDRVAQEIGAASSSGILRTRAPLAQTQYPRVQRVDEHGNLHISQMKKYHKGARKHGYTCHAHRWDDPEDEDYRVSLRNITPPVGRVLTYIQGGEVCYYDKAYLDKTHYRD